MRGTAVGLLYNLSLQAECAQPGLELRCSLPIQAQGRLVSAPSPWQLPAWLGPAWLDSLLPWQPSTRGSRYRSKEESAGAGAQAGEKKTKKHHNGGRQFGAFCF